MTGVELIAAERLRQVEEEGWDADHDSGHDGAELAVAAAELALDGTGLWIGAWGGEDMCGSIAKFGCQGISPNRLRRLVIAGALIAAEIDRVVVDTSGDTES
ncbi:MAG: hypothetical protein V3T08_09360 [Gemmatimonadota bacterium]